MLVMMLVAVIVIVRVRVAVIVGMRVPVIVLVVRVFQTRHDRHIRRRLRIYFIRERLLIVCL